MINVLFFWCFDSWRVKPLFVQDQKLLKKHNRTSLGKLHVEWTFNEEQPTPEVATPSAPSPVIFSAATSVSHVAYPAPSSAKEPQKPLPASAAAPPAVPGTMLLFYASLIHG